LIFPTIRVYIAYRIIPRIVVQIVICGTNSLFRPFLCQFWLFFSWDFISSTYIFGKSGCFHPDFSCLTSKKQHFQLVFYLFSFSSHKSVFV
jgi:hypothetical protein